MPLALHSTEMLSRTIGRAMPSRNVLASRITHSMKQDASARIFKEGRSISTVGKAGSRGMRSNHWLIGAGVASLAAGYILKDKLFAHPVFAESQQILAAGVPTSPSATPSDRPGFVLDPATSTAHPIVIQPISLKDSTTSPIAAPAFQTPQLTLVGLGVRTVSFLRVKVYSAAFYVDEETWKEHAKMTKGWEAITSTALLTPSPRTKQIDKPGSGTGSSLPASPGSTSAATTSTNPSLHVSRPSLSIVDSDLDAQPQGEVLMANILNKPIACAIRIVPTRNTDFGHLRDGFTRALAARQKFALKAHEINSEQADTISESIQRFKSFFPSTNVPKGQELLLIRTMDGKLAVEHEGKVLGVLSDPWVAREMMLAYFADQNVPSQALKEDAAKGLAKLLGRS